MATKKHRSGKVAAEVGAGLVAAAAAAGAGYYFYGSDKAKQHRAAATKWAKSMKADVLKETKKLKRIDQKQVTQIVDRVAAAYAGARVNPADLRAATSELKKNWHRVREEIASRVKKAGTARKGVKKAAKKSAPKKAVKKASKKAVKKAPKKAAKSTKKRSR